jgi:hypothetical protein
MGVPLGDPSESVFIGHHGALGVQARTGRIRR